MDGRGLKPVLIKFEVKIGDAKKRVNTAACKVLNSWFLVYYFQVSIKFRWLLCNSTSEDDWATIVTIATLILIKDFYWDAQAAVCKCST